MSGGLTACRSCGKRNTSDARYCIYCGSILKGIYCSSCGTKNPEDLEQCLECGNPLPHLREMRWKPIVTILQPTAAMIEQNPLAALVQREQALENTESLPGSMVSRLRAKFGRRQKTSGDYDD